MKFLKNLKKKEIRAKLEQLRESSGNKELAFDLPDLEGDFDPEKYDKLMAVSCHYVIHVSHYVCRYLCFLLLVKLFIILFIYYYFVFI